MTTNDYLDRIKQRHELPSDYALAQLLGTSRPQLFYIRQGRSLSADVQLKVAALLDIDPVELAIVGALERARSPEAKREWKKVLERLTGTAAVIFLGLSLSLHAEDPTTKETSHNQHLTHYVTCWRVS